MDAAFAAYVQSLKATTALQRWQAIQLPSLTPPLRAQFDQIAQDYPELGNGIFMVVSKLQQVNVFRDMKIDTVFGVKVAVLSFETGKFKNIWVLPPNKERSHCAFLLDGRLFDSLDECVENIVQSLQ